MSFPRRTHAATIAAAAVIAAAVTGCSQSTYDERMSFLRKVANRGVDTYKLLYSQESRIDKARCERAFEGNGVSADAPADMATGSRTPAWQAQIKEFFVDSCVSGKPKPVPGDLPDPSASPQASTTASPVSSPMRPAATATSTTKQ
ncbi:hypothetical protein ACGFI3_46115 [Nonomuraea wenchangensis]|uniref:hypothetical protein n=1 Tax=Nonomuraea wenchangensis TaxID=568860 RepID=UPI003713C83D